ncbi:hypothetical protein ACFV2N_18125 [Streptomyces sp. NPDC059680]|uniref:hypothetical protein n=1 Tax=Streptomyces sp. NPDC059680 TaxID=3346904 RepID=UPI00367DAF0A
MTLTEFDPSTRMPVAGRHESETRWGQALLAELGPRRLKEDVVDELVDETPCRLAAAGTGAIVTTVDGEVTTVTASARCTEPVCVAHGAALDTLNTEPFASLRADADLIAVDAACRAQLVYRPLVFNETSADEAVVWAYRTGMLREVVMYAAYQAFAHAARGEGAAEVRLRATYEDTRARAAELGINLASGPAGLLDDLAPLVELHPVRAGEDVRA